MDAKRDSEQCERVDIVVVGAGFAGMYLLYRLRQQGPTSSWSTRIGRWRYVVLESLSRRTLRRRKYAALLPVQ